MLHAEATSRFLWHFRSRQAAPAARFQPIPRPAPAECGLHRNLHRFLWRNFRFGCPVEIAVRRQQVMPQGNRRRIAQPGRHDMVRKLLGQFSLPASPPAASPFGAASLFLLALT